jgi:hypothetical protein
MFGVLGRQADPHAVPAPLACMSPDALCSSYVLWQADDGEWRFERHPLDLIVEAAIDAAFGKDREPPQDAAR